MLDPEVSPVADAITLKALQKKPLDRYQSAGEMREDIERGLSGQQVTAPVVPVDATARFLPPEDNDPRDARPANDWGPHDDEDEGPDRGRKIAYAMLAVAILFVLGVAAFIGLRAFGNANPDTLSAPTLVGSTPAEAEAILARNKLRLGQTEMAASETVPKGEIISQDPRAGDQVEVNSAVNITVSEGKPEVAVPEVIGTQIAEARSILTSRGFKVAEREDSGSTEDAGTVTRVTPREGTQAASGSTVTVYYSSGLIEVPNVLEQSEGEAEARLEDAGFKVRTVRQTTSEASAGTVIEQVPGSGSRRERGSTVTIVVAREPEPEPEPTPTPTETETETPTPTPTPTEPTETPDIPEPPDPPDAESAAAP